jgi:hypothetical protein
LKDHLPKIALGLAACGVGIYALKQIY